MPLPVLETTVRPDWQTITREMSIRRLRLWRAIEIVVALAALIALATGLLFPAWPLARVLPLVLFPVVFWLVPVWTLLRARMAVRPALVRALGSYAVLLVAILLAAITAPAALAGQGWGLGGSQAWVLSALLPLLTWPVLAWLARSFPAPARAMGLTTARWPVNLLIGVGAGAAMGLHLLLATELTVGLPAVDRSLIPLLAWTFFFLAGLFGTGEELLFRGLAYDLALGNGPVAPLRPILRIVLLNALVYLCAWPSLGLQGLGIVFWFLASAVATTLVTTYLRHRQQSLLPALVCRVLFGTVAVLIFVP